MAPGKFEWKFRHVIFKQILVIDVWGISSENALIWMSLDSADDQSTLVQVMAWCSQATSHYLSQYWPRSLSPYGVTRPQWINEPLHNMIIYIQNNHQSFHSSTRGEAKSIPFFIPRNLAIEVYKCVTKNNPAYLNKMFNAKKFPYGLCDDLLSKDPVECRLIISEVEWHSY